MPMHGSKPKPKSKKPLKGGQKKLDKDGDGKLSKRDFEMLRKGKKGSGGQRSKLTDKQEEKMKEHAKHHSKKHMSEMRKLMMKGHSFTKAHNEVKKMEKK